NYIDKNNKNIRDEFLYLDKKINLLLKDDNINEKDNENENENDYLYKNKRYKSECPIRDRIILLTDVKNQIRTENPCVPGSIPGGTTQKSRFIIESAFFVGNTLVL
ncbi:MAG: hypothetical protein J6Y11_09405, partial [Paludibacteraceae bacterium]|nr:hypothetical protein [Paludibacteraceae bacterium]